MKNILHKAYPDAVDPTRIGTYPVRVKSGGGYFFDKVLEYRVWVHPSEEDVYYRAFANYLEALEFSKTTDNAEAPLALVSQDEYIDESTSGKYIHVRKPRLAEWLPEWLENSQGTKVRIPEFLKNNNT